MKVHRFVREDNSWYIDLPEYIEQGGSKGDLEMVSGADTMLDIIAGKVRLRYRYIQNLLKRQTN